MTSNVLLSWGGYLVYIVAGFVMPRLIDRHLGQFSLGVWDFGWSLVNYLGLTGLGVGSSVNRYVAKYRAANQVQELRIAVSSVVCIQVVLAGVVLLLTGGLVWTLPWFFADRLGSEIESAQWVVAFLGTSLAVQMAFDTSRGVMTGCHRWDLHNGINAGAHAATVAAMILVLLLGGGLRGLSVVYLCTVAVTEVLRVVLAHRVCPELRIRLAYAGWSQARKMFLFGGKTAIASLSPLILVQTTNVFVVSALGPAALAVFSRPMALVRHVETLMNKYAFLMTPTAGSLQASGRDAEISHFLMETTRYGVAFTLPILLFLSIFSDLILQIWMGPQYAHGLVLTILAAGYFLPISQNSVMRILMGMNFHGRIGLLNLGVAIAGFSLGAIIVNAVGWSLVGAALLVAIPLTIGNGIIVPIYACRKLGVPLTEYLRRAFLGPAVCALPFGLCLVSSRVLFPDNALATFGIGSAVGALVLGVLYWRYMLSEQLRSRLLKSVGHKLRPIRI